MYLDLQNPCDTTLISISKYQNRQSLIFKRTR